MKKLGILLLFSVLLIGCNKPKEAVIPVDFESENMEKFGEKVKSLNEEDKALLNSYITRSKGIEGSEGFFIPVGTTVGEAIEYENQWQAKVEANNKANSEAFDQWESEIEAKTAEFNKAVQITILDLSYEFSHVSAKIRIDNTSNKTITGIKSRFHFYNKFEDSPEYLFYVIDDIELPPGYSVERRVSQLLSYDRWKLLTDAKYESFPEFLSFNDGTNIKIPDMSDLNSSFEN